MHRSTVRPPMAAALALVTALASPVPLAADNLVISEIMASNRSDITDIDGDYSDWVEIANIGAAPCDLGGYFLTDDVRDLEKWEFPPVTLGPNRYLLVFASEKDRRDPARELHANFRLDREGDLLVLVAPDGQTPVAGFAPSYPPQVTDASYGISTSSTIDALVETGSPVRARVPADASLGTTWTQIGFADGAWPIGTQGVGFERATGFENLIGLDVNAAMYGVNSSIYVRIPFRVGDPAAIDSLVLGMRYDDGFVAWINGVRVADGNAPSAAALAFDSSATASHADSRARELVDFDLSAHLGRLVAGDNVLAIQGLNFSPTSSDFLISAELRAIAIGDIDIENHQYFDVPTPGATNGPGYAEVSADVQFSQPSGAYASNVSLTLSVPGGGEIRYTLDGSTPDAADPLYSSAVTISTVSIVTARSFQSGKMPGRAVNATYVIVDTTARNFSSNLPIVIVDTRGATVGQNTLVPALFQFIETDETGRARITDPADHAGRGGIKIRGSSSTGFPKKQYAVEMWDEFGDDLDVPLLGMPRDSDWVLYAPYSDKALMRNFLSYDWGKQVDRYAVRTRFVEVYFKSATGRLTNAHYAGVYVLMEKIKRGADRVDIAKLSSTDNAEPEISGGYILKKDRLDPGDSGMTTSRGHTLGFVEPKEREITAAQRTYLANFFNSFENALYGASFRDPSTGYRRYIDTRSFIDNHILVELTKNIDGYRLSSFFYKDRGGKLHMGPIWDYNLSLGNANYLNGWIPQGWYWEQLGDDAYPWFRRLFQDPDFQQEYIDRWNVVRRRVFPTATILAQVDEVAAFLDESQRRNFVTWPILGQYVWPNWYIANTYREEIDWMKGWIEDRLEWYDSNYLTAPVLNQDGGAIDPPFDLTIAAPMGTVYYTTDGSDPRLPGGLVNPTAIEHGSSDAVELVSASVTSEVRVLVPVNNGVDATWTGVSFNDAGWTRSTAGIGVGYERGAGYDNLIDVDVEAAMYNQRTTVYIRLRFDLVDPAAYDFLALEMKYDDGFVAYLNGNRIAASNAPGVLAWDAAASAQHDDASAVNFVPFALPDAQRFLRAGTNVLAIHGLNAGVASSDLLFVPRLVASSVEAGSAVRLNGPTRILARARNGASWSGLTGATFVPNSALPLRVTELHYHPANLPDGSPFDEEDLEFVELRNIGAAPLDLTGVRFSDGVEFDFNASAFRMVPAGEYFLVVRNLAAFDWYYGAAGLWIAGEFTGRLENAGESIGLLDGRGELVQDFAYRDVWHPSTDGGGPSLHIVDSSRAKETWNDPVSWTASALAGGSPGRADSDVGPESGWQLPGDANQDGRLDVSDPVKLLRRLFLADASALPCDGVDIAAGGNLRVFDANGDAAVDLSDALHLLAHLFGAGPAPAGGGGCIRVVGCPSACVF